ncbi:hypothetical protein [Sphingobium sp. CECT 9361]|uniref:hypothetical protein n=1 Tax=Sphingobium sp. CECT 9361 TaxID=2845384 RepID=UPI001E64918B|nr:hypothetical protein [Sphingobium sp. CECT 9361]CAH0350963.1 hypothetical protein SPH9361_01366 [Sphingobium sp. CECT 9361]
MAEPKPFASLTSGLLARKGAASPAMRRQVMLNGMTGAAAISDPQHHDDLGWNDMGEDSVRQSDPLAVAGLAPMGGSPLSFTPAPIVDQMPVPEDAPVPVVIEQRRVLSEKLSPVSPEPTIAAPVLPTAPLKQTARSKAAFTLRLDPERHLRLRLACAVANRSAQHIVTQALDAFLDSQPQIDALAEQLPRPRGTDK